MTTTFGKTALFAVALSFMAAVPTATADDGCCKPAVTSSHESSITVNARPELVYRSLVNLKEDDADKVKALSRKPNECLVEEIFDDLPMIGKAKCIYKEVYTPGKRVEYKLVESDKFKVFEGCWRLTPTADGEKTQVSLTSAVEINTCMPFAKQIAGMQTKKEVKERLASLKKVCEKEQLSAAVSQTTQKNAATVH